jgi:hypothetical protein
MYKTFHASDGLYIADGHSLVFKVLTTNISIADAEEVCNLLNAAQQSVQRTVAKCAPDQHDFSKSINCAKCGELLF